MVRLAFILKVIAILLYVLLMGCAEDIPEIDAETATLEDILAGIDPTKISFEEYFPLNTGNVWEYQLLFNNENIGDYRMELDGETAITNKEPEIVPTEWFPGRAEDIVSQDFFQCNYKRLSSELGNISSVDYYAISDNRVLYAPSTDLQQREFFGEWEWPGILLFLTPEMITGKEIVTVPAGTFACIKITRENCASYEILDMDPDDIVLGYTSTIPVYEWYSIGVGMVKREYKHSYHDSEFGVLHGLFTYQLTRNELYSKR